MRLTYDELCKKIREGLIEEAVQYYEDVKLTTGDSVKYGDANHLKDMEGMIHGMETLRDQQRRGTAARSIYATAVRQLKMQIKATKARHEQTTIDPDSEAMSIEKPGKPRKQRPGFDGGRSTTPGHGRYEPGAGG